MVRSASDFVRDPFTAAYASAGSRRTGEPCVGGPAGAGKLCGLSARAA